MYNVTHCSERPISPKNKLTAGRRSPDAARPGTVAVALAYATPPVQRCTDGSGDVPRLQRLAASGADGVMGSGVAALERFAADPGAGHPLPADAHRYFGPRLRADLTGVRVHTDVRAATAARELDARALTVGQHIAFAPGQFNPSSTAGRRLLAHELAHTVQQGRSPGSASGPLRIGHADDGFERDARLAAEQVVSGGASISGPTADLTAPAVQRYSFHEFLDDAESAASGAYDTAGSAIRSVAQSGERALDAAGELAGDIGGAAAEAAGAVRAAAGTAVAGVETAAETAVAAVESVYERGRAAAESAWNAATGLARDAWAAVRTAGGWLYARGAAVVTWVGEKLLDLARWLGSLVGVTITPEGSGVRIGLPDIELLPREDRIPLPIFLPEQGKTIPIAALPIPVGPGVLLPELDAKATIAARSAANIGPVVLRAISFLLDPRASHYQGTGELDAPAEAALQIITTATLLGQASVVVPVGEIPVRIPTIGLEGGLRLTGQGTVGGAFTNRVTLDYAGGRVTFGDLSQLGLGLLLEADLDAILGLTLLEKDVCSWAWHLGRVAWGRALQGTLDLELAAGGGPSPSRRLVGRIQEIPVEDVIRGVFELHPEPNCPGLGAILRSAGVPTEPGPLGIAGVGGAGGTGPFDIVWPPPTWQTAGHGDTGATGGIQRPPAVIFRKRPSPPRDQSVINRYIARNRAKFNPSYQVHHKWPLFVSGPDTEPNLVFLTASEHSAWHKDLYDQSHGYLPSDPDKTEYHIVKYK